ncbi:MAG: cytochrome c biogenesis protein CcdA [Actinobacteria bacterium]|nr:cytochrome c biogenesis protein CcdA [Actinomycetota bacterium]
MEVFTLPILAVVAGAISFSSPCCLPLIPGYLSYMSALPVSELGTREARRTTLRAAVLFVAGFTVVFTALGISFALIGSVLLRNVPLITRISGVLIIGLGLAMLGVLRVPLLYRERRFDLARVPPGPRAAFFMGVAFAFGWAPCIGPVLATILAAAAATSTGSRCSTARTTGISTAITSDPTAALPTALTTTAKTKASPRNTIGAHTSATPAAVATPLPPRKRRVTGHM